MPNIYQFWYIFTITIIIITNHKYWVIILLLFKQYFTNQIQLFCFVTLWSSTRIVMGLNFTLLIRDFFFYFRLENYEYYFWWLSVLGRCCNYFMIEQVYRRLKGIAITFFLVNSFIKVEYFFTVVSINTKNDDKVIFFWYRLDFVVNSGSFLTLINYQFSEYALTMTMVYLFSFMAHLKDQVRYFLSWHRLCQFQHF